MAARVAKLEDAMEYVQRDLGEIKSDVREIKRDARTDFRVTLGSHDRWLSWPSWLARQGFPRDLTA
jgi:hypothetical protein